MTKQTNAEEIQTRKILLALKDILKNRGITYNQIASLLNMSESGIKKIFSGHDCSLNKLLTICNYLQINISDVVDYSVQHRPKENVIPPSVEKFFIQNFDYWRVLYLMVSDEMSPRELMKEWNLSEQQMTKYLLKLDQLDMIKFYSLDKVSLPPIDSFEFADAHADEGEMMRLMRILVVEDFLETTFFNDEYSKEDMFDILSIKLTKHTYRKFIEELMELDAKYNTKSNYERSIYKVSEMTDVCYAFGAINEPWYKRLTDQPS
jgi:DNA-binding Xre family transcriptional regulator